MDASISLLPSPAIDLRSTSFSFSQASLQAYIDCPRRFQLRYLYTLAWPATEVQPIQEHEQHMQRGQAFHQLVQQYFLGISPERLSRLAVVDPLLNQWWQDFQQENPVPNSYHKFIETSIFTPVGDHRLIARYDLVAADADHWVIFDWKTHRKRPKRGRLEKLMQSLVYPFVLTEAGKGLAPESTIDPEQIEMVYWFSNFPTSPMRFQYSTRKYEQDRAKLSDLVSRITALDENSFLRTDDLAQCRYCVYRSFCDRGKEAGSVEDLEIVNALEEGLVEDFDFDLDLDQIAEIEF